MSDDNTGKSSAPPPSLSDLTENVLFMPRIYNETLKLLLQAHDYFHRYGADEQKQLAENMRTLFACEMSRITMRLSCVMAWLMVQKAVLVGRISREDAAKDYRLDCRDICLHRNEEATENLPAFMNHLLAGSYDLYRRVSVLDDQSVAAQENSTTRLH